MAHRAQSPIGVHGDVRSDEIITQRQLPLHMAEEPSARPAVCFGAPTARTRRRVELWRSRLDRPHGT